MLVHIEYPTQEKDVQDQLEAAVMAANPADADQQGLIRIVIGALVYIGKLFISARHRRFVVERCEPVGNGTKHSDAVAKKATTAPVKVAPAKKVAKRSASKQAKRSTK